MVEKSDFDPSELDTLDDLKKIVDEQGAAEKKEENKRMEGHVAAAEADKLMDSTEQHEAATDQRRMIDEVNDRKEEDGGENRE